MARPKKVVPTDLSVEEIKKLLVLKERMEALELRRDNLEKKKKLIDKGLKKIDSDLARLSGRGLTKRGRKKKKKKVAKKKAVRKTRKKAAKKVVRRKAKKTAKKKVRKTRRRAVKKTTVKKTRKKAVRKTGKATRARSKMTLEDVVVKVIKANRKPMEFQDILSTIEKKKLVKTKSKNFANVLRRTLSTSTKVKRVGRGIYTTA